MQRKMLMASARALQCPGCQEFDTQYEYKEKYKHRKLISERPGHKYIATTKGHKW